MNEVKAMPGKISDLGVKKQTQIGLTVRRVARGPISVLCFVVIMLIVVVAVLAPVLAPYGYEEMDLFNILAGPSKSHLCGTDELGRDVLSRLIYGARNSLLIGLFTTVISCAVGIPLGLIAGYFGKTADTVIMRVSDIFQAIPDMLLAIAISAALGIGLENCIISISICRIPGFARMARAASLNVAGMEYVEAAKAMDMKRPAILLRHIFPNSLSPLIVQMTMTVANSIVQAASLSFIGLGVQPPQAEWGCMLSAGREYIRSHPHMLIAPLVAILILVLALNLFGDGLRDALDPKMKK
ncbi:MAG: ABC transporter permease [Oscillospiraceae bacterium]|nr:ABC transporter permease [Oscillospiraceae bacterium]